jgi:glycosyltransferase involved in cell wall biosynthesis
MRIGVDVSPLSEPITGIGRYTLSLLEVMVLDKSHQWVLYSHRPLLHGNWSQSNIVVRAWNLPKWVRMLRMLWSQSLLPFWAKQDNIDLFWSPAHRLPRYLSKSTASVVTIHDLVWRHAPETMRPLSRFLDAKFMPEAISLADQVIAVSKATEGDLLSEIPEAKDKVNVVYEANSLHFDNFSKFNKVDDEYILFVGTLEPRKNLRRLLEAYSLLSDPIRDKYHLIIVGGKGWGNEDINSIIEQLNIKKFVKVLGYLSNKELVKIYSQAYLFVMPSLYEGFGLPVLEAMSLGIPVVTSNISSLPEIVGDTAILVNPKSVSSIKIGIEEVLMDIKLRKRLSKATLERSKIFSWNNASKETLSLFEQALAKRIK